MKSNSRGKRRFFEDLEFSNSSAADCRIYANEGIVQMLFFQGDPFATTYQKRKAASRGVNQPHLPCVLRILFRYNNPHFGMAGLNGFSLLA